MIISKTVIVTLQDICRQHCKSTHLEKKAADRIRGLHFYFKKYGRYLNEEGYEHQRFGSRTCQADCLREENFVQSGI